MKNLLVYTGPEQKFEEEHEVLARIQIDNSLDLGWKKEDILVVTDFQFEYNSIKSVEVPKNLFYPFDKKANKIPVIKFLIQKDLVDSNEIYWCHDFDAYQLNVIEEKELGLEQFVVGLCHYSYKPEWQFGSVFFKKSAGDIFDLVDKTTRSRPYQSRNNEKTLTWLIKHNRINPERYKRMNVTYNIMKRYLETIYREADKPLKVLHFRPNDQDALMAETALNMFMYGKNRLGVPLMTPRLIKIFHHHGIK